MHCATKIQQFFSYRYADIDGSNRHTVLEGVPHGFAITVIGKWMYWTDMNLKTVEKANCLTGADRQVLTNTIQVALDIKIVHQLRQTHGMNNWNDY